MGADSCPLCGEELPAEARFCAYCGARVAPAAARVAAREERRVITAMFADLAGSTQLGELLDPEDFRDLTGDALALMGAAIEELGGTVRGTAGDGVLGLFGAPTAHEDDAERAVVAGLRLVQRMRSYAEEAVEKWHVPTLHVRVGIETGLAVLGEVRAGSQVQYDASGDCLNTAARLEGAAQADGVLVGPVTRRLVNDAFLWGESRPLALKGKAEAVVACHALAPQEDSPGPGRRTESGSRLVGRARELATAGEILAGVRAGDSASVFVTGQAGIGKTRFMKELRSLFEAGGQGAHPPIWLEGTCLSYGLDEPYLPFRQVVRQALGAVDSADGVHRALAARVGARRADRVAPVLGMILGLEPKGDEASRAATLSVESRQQAVVDAFVALVDGLAENAPVAVVIDDAHWADAATLRLVEGMISALADAPRVMLVLAMRPETERGAWSLRQRALDDHPARSHELGLSSLERVAERSLISDLVGEGTLPDELESVLLGRAEGNPFYLRELLRSLQDTGAITEDAGGWRFDHDATVEVPETVERVVLARIDRLPPSDRDLLSSAAVLGREFDLSLLARIVGAELSPGSLSNLTRLGLFEPGTGAEYRFSHPLIQETAYSSMLRRGRADLHRRAAAAIEELTEAGTVEHHTVLARHHRAAGHVAEAVKYHRLAALASQHLVAMDEALNQLDLALATADSLDPDARRAQVPELYLLRGHTRGRTGDYAGGTDDLRQALAGARAVGDEQVEMQALNELGWLMRVHGYADAISHHEDALRIAEKLDDPAAQVTALSRLSMIRLNRLQLDVGLDLAWRALEIARRTGRDQLLGTALDCLKLAALQLGHLDLLEQTVAEIVEVQQRAGDLYLLQWAHIEGATAPLARGDLTLARARIEKAVEINKRFASDRIARALILEASSWIDRLAGDPQAAVSAVRQAIETVGERSTPEWSAWLEASLGSHLLATGNATEAIVVLESALGNSDAINSPNRAFRAASHLARARQLVGDDVGSRIALDRARDVLGMITAPPGAVFLDGYQSYLALAQTCIAQGDRQEARDLLEPVRAAARDHGWRAAEEEVAALLDPLVPDS